MSDIGQSARDLALKVLTKEIELADKRTQLQRWTLEIGHAHRHIAELEALRDQLSAQLAGADQLDLDSLKAAADAARTAEDGNA